MNTTITNGGGQVVDAGDVNNKDYKLIVDALKICDENEWDQYLDNFKQKQMTDSELKFIIDDDLWNKLIPNEDVRIRFQAIWRDKCSPTIDTSQ